MKKILLAGLVLSAFVGGSATAADLARPVYKAAPPPVEVFDWSGIYIGGHVGWGFAETDITAVIESVHVVDVPEQAPPHPLKVLPLSLEESAPVV